MGRKDYQADLQAVRSGAPPPGIVDLVPGDDDGSFNFSYVLSDSTPVALTAFIPELSSYPRDHFYMVYVTSDNAPKALQDAVSDMTYNGKRLLPMLEDLSSLLQRACNKAEEIYINDSDESMDDGIEGTDDEAEVYEDDEFGLDEPFTQSSMAVNSQTKSARIRPAYELEELRRRLKSDLWHVKRAGFRISHAADLLDENSYLMISIRISHLSIQEDALKAWNLKAEEYIMLVIQYKDGYVPLEEINAGIIGHDVILKVVLSKNYKIPITDAVAVCSDSDVNTKTSGSTRELFIGPPLNELLKNRLASIIKYRISMNLGWAGAEEYYNDHQSQGARSTAVDKKYYEPEKYRNIDHLPAVVRADHLAEHSKPFSFPLLAMQFTVRHIVRCTEFCLVCFCHIEGDFEAIRPYVCSKPLCLYQYMSLGFGPSIEHEILTQAHVVDLLISFCYAASSSKSLRSTPEGMGLTFPASIASDATKDPQQYQPPPRWRPSTPQDTKPTPVPQPKYKEVLFDGVKNEFLFKEGVKDPELYVGRWVEIDCMGGELQHRRVVEVFYPSVRLGPPIKAMTATPVATEESWQSNPDMRRADNVDPTLQGDIDRVVAAKSKGNLYTVAYEPWNCNFDDYDRITQQSVITGLLCLLPTIPELVSHLQSVPEKNRSLRKWVDRIPPSALGLLRWIIASNRSCIVQVDNLLDSAAAEDRVSGMNGYMQFRFATGAPDKEQRFLNAVKTQQEAKKLTHPTIFAWHGSMVGNWHGIVREGLNFDRALNGRAYGDGVYHSLHSSTSEGYARSYHYGGSSPVGWPGSDLGVHSALCLNEIVNVPAEYVSRSPHLVVNQLDWIQTRYLFVRCDRAKDGLSEKVPTQTVQQDPSMRPLGSGNTAVEIPLDAINKGRRSTYSTTKGKKRTKLWEGSKEEPLYVSDSSDNEDVALYQREEKIDSKKAVDASITSYEPGQLDLDSLPLLAPPSYATTKATQALQRELKNILHIQNTRSQQELGWYINADEVSNMYQWIFELHSFDKSLPLAKDMEKNKIQSIVLELRFGKDFPFSPPFVRVIRPRFLPFLQGGGGHVTAGGAMCMELLTNNGWNVASSIEAVLLQIRMAITSLEPKPARLQISGDYSAFEARDAFIRACTAHGWEVPKDFHEITNMQSVQGESARW